jgi:F-type H+-transporting ATPase subunit delta
MAKLVSKAYSDALFESVLEDTHTEDLQTTELLFDAEEHANKKEQAGVERLYQDSQTLKTQLLDNPQFLELLKHPDISKEEKEAVLARVFERWMMPELYGLLRLLVEKDRIGWILDILEDVSERYKAYMNIGVVYVASPEQLPEKKAKEIEKKILDTTGFETLEMHYQTDATLIGGLVIRIGDRVVDGSVKTRLENMTRKLKNIQIQ